MKIIHPEKPEDSHLLLLLYALTGAGKTTFCGTAEDCLETSPTLVVDIGGNIVSLAKRWPSIAIVRPKSMTEVQEIYEYFRFKNRRGGKQRYKSVCIDGFTGMLQELIIPMCKEEGEDPYEDLSLKNPTTRQHFLRGHEVTRRTFRAFRDLAQLPDPSRRVHVIITALEKLDEGRSIVCPQFPGVMGVECGAYVNVLARLYKRPRGEAEKITRYLMTDEMEDDDGNNNLAKNCGGWLGRGVWDPSVSKLVRRWKQAGGAK